MRGGWSSSCVGVDREKCKVALANGYELPAVQCKLPRFASYYHLN